MPWDVAIRFDPPEHAEHVQFTAYGAMMLLINLDEHPVIKGSERVPPSPHDVLCIELPGEEP
jgi:hypothetical protein